MQKTKSRILRQAVVQGKVQNIRCVGVQINQVCCEVQEARQEV